jgi:hypothetical protein
MPSIAEYPRQSTSSDLAASCGVRHWTRVATAKAPTASDAKRGPGERGASGRYAAEGRDGPHPLTPLQRTRVPVVPHTIIHCPRPVKVLTPAPDGWPSYLPPSGKGRKWTATKGPPVDAHDETVGDLCASPQKSGSGTASGVASYHPGPPRARPRTPARERL